MTTSGSFRSPARADERGTVLLLTLIVLVVLLIGGVALVRSFDTTLLTAGNIAFKRDLVNQGERVVPKVIGPNGIFQATAGPLKSAAARAASLPASNYSATILPTSPQGVPLALLSNADFASVGVAANDIRADGVSVRYVVDRMCNAAGLDTELGAAKCILAENDLSQAVDINNTNTAEFAGSGGQAGAVPQQVVYRISVRVDGPRNTQTFLQTTFSL